MKSLEVVKNVLKVYEMDGSTFGLLYVEDLKEIKQDLEILEIIRNKRVNVAELVGELIYFDNDEDVLEDYNSILCKGRQLTLTELLKLKQWLDDNKD